jgi:hypothetical protein
VDVAKEEQKRGSQEDDHDEKPYGHQDGVAADFCLTLDPTPGSSVGPFGHPAPPFIEPS